VVICNDAEESGAGEEGALETATALCLAGRDVRLAELPRPDGKPKIDVNEFVREHGVEAFRKILAGALPLVEFEIRRISTDAPAAELDNGIRGLAKLLAHRSEIERARYVAQIAKRFDLPRPVIRRALQTASQGGDASSDLRQGKVKPSSSTPDMSSKDDRPRILIRNDLTEVTDEAQGALLARFPSEKIFQRGGQLVRVMRAAAPPEGKQKRIRRNDGAPVIEPIPPAALRELMGVSARWCKPSRSSALVALPPMWCVDTLRARGRWPFPLLVAVVEEPTLRPDGSVLQEHGYDPATGILFVGATEFPAVPDRPTDAEVEEAISDLRDVLCDFPWVSECDEAAAMAAILTIVCRHAFDGPAPLFAIRANTPATGKGLLAAVIALVGTGRKPTLMAPAQDDEEMRKRILSIALAGDRVVLVDNVEGTLGSPALAAALTSTEIADRVLGESKIVRAPLTCTWLVTGNNLAFRGDAGRRVVPIDLETKEQHPEDRGDFRHPELLAYVAERRPKLVAAALTIARAYHVRGAPPQVGPRLGSFEGWDDLVRSTMREVVVGLGDPCKGRVRIREDGDLELEELRALHTVWRTHFGQRAVTVAEAISAAAETQPKSTVLKNPDLMAVLSGLSKKGDLNPKSVGWALRKRKHRIVDGCWLDTGEPVQGTHSWRVVHLEAEEGGAR
jgi:putative DNA primase/helicase